MKNDVLERVQTRFSKFEQETGIPVVYNQLQGKPRFRADVKVGKDTRVFNKKGKLVLTADNPRDAYARLVTMLNSYLSKADLKAIWKDSRSARGLQYT